MKIRWKKYCWYVVCAMCICFTMMVVFLYPGTAASQATYTISAVAWPYGSISPGGMVTVNAGDNITFTITPDPGYYIQAVLIDGEPLTEPQSTYEFLNVTADHTIVVYFSYTITATAGADGTISPSGVVMVLPGADQSFIFTPDTDFTIADVVVDGLSKPTGTSTTYPFINVTANHSIAVSFVPASNHYNTLFGYLYGIPTGTKPNWCGLCHTPHSALMVIYGLDFYNQRQQQYTPYQSFKNIEQIDSDGDGFTNIVEINAYKDPSDPLDHP